MNELRQPKAIGGYFELELPSGGTELYPAARKFQSARAAFTSLLQHIRPGRIWMPWYICDSMLEGPEAAEVPVKRYTISESLYPIDISLMPGDCLLYVNYFGLCDQQVGKLLREFPANQIILDYSQAFYAAPPNCLGTLYSPRKFFGVPDGGYLFTNQHVKIPQERDDQSIDRMEPLLLRISRGPEGGYPALQVARASLKRQSPKTMSLLTETMLDAIDYSKALATRNENFRILHDALSSMNRFPIPTLIPDGPMCYPLLLGASIHSWLIEHRVFVGHYWPNIAMPNRTDCNVEEMLATTCVPLPCDQRYGKTEMERIVDLTKEFLRHQRR